MKSKNHIKPVEGNIHWVLLGNNEEAFGWECKHELFQTNSLASIYNISLKSSILKFVNESVSYTNWYRDILVNLCLKEKNYEAKPNST